MATASSSTSITVAWTEPSMPNGIIRHYIVTHYRSVIGMSDAQQVTITSGTTAELTDLDVFTNYTIFVQAVTVAAGEMGGPVTVITSEDG